MSTNIKVNFEKKTGKRIQPLHGFNSGPMTKVFTYDARPLFVEGGFPYVRLHDSEYPYGSGEFIDIPCIFKNFDADENDPASYNFGNTDEYIRQCLNVGSKIIYRLGVSIEHSPVKRYTHPPKDFAKWARICEHIIRHYNEGWADGFLWNIEYWEIWNEPDLDRNTDNKRCWGGTAAEFAELYTVAARHLKACFPHLRIGGCGFSNVRNEFIEEFFSDISKRSPRVPLDFYTWHRYKGEAAAYVEGAAIVRSLLTEFGYGEVESILDEWNLMYAWDRANQAESYRAMKDHRGASFYAATLCALQEQTDVTIATQFEADVVKEFCGVFNVKNMCVGGLSSGSARLAELEPTKGFYAFKSFNSLYRMGDSVTLHCDHDDIFATAAAGECGNGVLLSNQSGGEVDVTLSLSGVRGSIIVRLTDADRSNERILELDAGATCQLRLSMRPDSFAYIGTDLPDPVPNDEA
ncbi:MAG: hypothetical protein IJX39_03805 [Clostridia bacterium]|nr:hypothetical protein [Clostridia bacterium]